MSNMKRESTSRKRRPPDMTIKEKQEHRKEIEAALAAWDGTIEVVPGNSVLCAIGQPSLTDIRRRAI